MAVAGAGRASGALLEATQAVVPRLTKVAAVARPIAKDGGRFAQTSGLRKETAAGAQVGEAVGHARYAPQPVAPPHSESTHSSTRPQTHVTSPPAHTTASALTSLVFCKADPSALQLPPTDSGGPGRRRRRYLCHGHVAPVFSGAFLYHRNHTTTLSLQIASVSNSYKNGRVGIRLGALWWSCKLGPVVSLWPGCKAVMRRRKPLGAGLPGLSLFGTGTPHAPRGCRGSALGNEMLSTGLPPIARVQFRAGGGTPVRSGHAPRRCGPA